MTVKDDDGLGPVVDELQTLVDTLRADLKAAEDQKTDLVAKAAEHCHRADNAEHSKKFLMDFARHCHMVAENLEGVVHDLESALSDTARRAVKAEWEVRHNAHTNWDLESADDDWTLQMDATLRQVLADLERVEREREAAVAAKMEQQQRAMEAEREVCDLKEAAKLDAHINASIDAMMTRPNICPKCGC
jgi:hypothetical protein